MALITQTVRAFGMNLKVGVRVPLRLRHFQSQKLWHFHRNIRLCVENEFCCPHKVCISNVNFTCFACWSCPIPIGLALPGYVEHWLSMHQPSGSMPAGSHLLTSVLTHSNHVFLFLPLFLAPEIRKLVIDLIWPTIHNHNMGDTDSEGPM